MPLSGSNVKIRQIHQTVDGKVRFHMAGCKRVGSAERVPHTPGRVATTHTKFSLNEEVRRKTAELCF